MQKEMVVAAVVGLILLVVSFNLFIPLNRATGNLYQFFVDSCKEGNSYFAKAYVGVTELSGTTTEARYQYDTNDDIFGGSGVNITYSGRNCQVAATTGAGSNVATGAATLYNEQGDQIGTATIATAGTIPATTLTTGTYTAYKPADLLGDFVGIIRTLVSLSPVIITAGFLALAGVGLVRYGMGVGSGGIGGAIGGAVAALILNIIVMFLSPIGMQAVVDAGQTTQTGALAVNQEFSGVQRLLFSVIPLIMVATVIGSNLVAGGIQYGFMGKMKRGMGGGGMMGV